MKAGLKAHIKGPSAPYIFEYEIHDPNNLLIEGQEITSFSVNIFSIEAYVFGDGNELIELWFEDRSVIKDLANNSLAEGRITGSLNEFEYISEGKLTSLIV